LTGIETETLTKTSWRRDGGMEQLMRSAKRWKRAKRSASLTI